MRILTLANTPLDPASGSGYVVCGYAEGLRALGATVDLLGPADFEPWTFTRRAIGYRQALGMALASRARGYDILETYGGEAWLAVETRRRSRERPLLVAHSNGIEPHCDEILAAHGLAAGRLRRRLHHLLWDRAFRGVDALVTVGAFDAAYAERRGYVAARRLLAIDNPLPAEYLGRGWDPERPPVLGFCGSWIERKGIRLLSVAAGNVLRRNRAWRLLLVGVGTAMRPGDWFAADVLPQIDVIPHAERGSALLAVYGRLRILAMPSLYESFGLVATEAMACGCALVATRTGFAAGLRADVEAVLVEADVAGLEAGIERLVRDDAARRAIAGAGHARVQGLRWDTAAHTLFDAYGRWLAEHRRRERP